MIKEVLILILAYLLGNISPSYFFGRLKGRDIRKIGSKNAGATNAFRVLGPFYGITTGVIDIAKGFFVIFFSFQL